MRRLLPLSMLCLSSHGAIAAPPQAAQSARTGQRFPVPATLPRGIVAGASVEGITEYRLANEMRVLLFPDASTPVTLVNVTYAVGASQENYGESGMAHLLEHLLFKGTPTTPNIAAEFKRRGITFNGSTGRDRTNYYGSFSPNPATLDWLLAAEADRMVNANVARSELDSEMTVVRNELEISENKPTTLLGREMEAQAYQWHAYGKSVLGNRSDIENVPIDRLQAFYRRWYQPDTATVTVAGSFDPAHVLQVVQRTFGRLKKPKRVLPANYTLEPAQDGEREVTIRRAGDVPLFGIAYHTPAITHRDSAALQVLDSVMGSTPRGRLYQALVAPGLATVSQSGVGNYNAPGLISFYAAAIKGADPAVLEKALIDQVEGIVRRPITAAEVADAKQRLANIYDRANDTNVIGVANGLSESIAAGDWRLWFTNRDAITRVTADDVNRVARTYVVPANRTLARFLPTDKPVMVTIAQAPSVASVVDGYAGRRTVATGEVFDTALSNVAARTETITLGEGLKVSLLPKKSRGGRVTVGALFHFGDEASDAKYRDAGNLAGDLLMRGSATMTYEQISQRIDDLKSRISVNGDAASAIVSITTDGANLAPALALVADLLRHPAFPAAEFEQLKAQSLSVLEQRRHEPGQIVDYAMRRYFDRRPAGDPRGERTLDEELAAMKALTLEDVRTAYARLFGTSNGEIAIVGDFDPVAVKRDLTTLFAGWSSRTPYVRRKEPFFAPARTIRQAFETPDKANAVIVSRSAFAMPVDDPDQAALQAASRIFGNGAKASRLGDRIREREGLSYYVGSGVLIDDETGNGTFYMQATSAPENMARVETAMREELARYVRDGITAGELEVAKASLLDAYRDGRSSDSGLVGTLRSNLYLDRSLQWDMALEQRVRSLTLDQVNGAIRRRIDPNAVSTFVAGDFARVAHASPSVATTVAAAK